MTRKIRLRTLLPVAQCGLAVLFGGVGLWQRHETLNQPWFGNQTLWDTTARLHVWPWPYKFAAILNMPAFIGGMLLSSLLGVFASKLPEIVQSAQALVFVPPLWYWVGSRLDRRLGEMDGSPSSKSAWAFLLVLILICLVGAFLPLAYVGYLPYGIAVWIAASLKRGRRANTVPESHPAGQRGRGLRRR